MASNTFFTTQAASPQKDHYAQWTKEKLYYMEVFSEREIKQLR